MDGNYRDAWRITPLPPTQQVTLSLLRSGWYNNLALYTLRLNYPSIPALIVPTKFGLNFGVTNKVLLLSNVTHLECIFCIEGWCCLQQPVRIRNQSESKVCNQCSQGYDESLFG